LKTTPAFLPRILLALLLSQGRLCALRYHSMRASLLLSMALRLENGVAERRWEEQFRAVPASASAREHLRRLTAEPHVAGTKED